MSKKVLLIRGINPENYGGAEKYQINLGKELKNNGYNPIIMTPSRRLLEEAYEAGLEAAKIPHIRLQNWSGFRNFLLPVFIVWEIYLYFWYIRAIKKYKPEVIHIQSRDEYISATLAAKKKMIKIIWTDHTDFRWAWENLKVKHKNPIGKYIYKLAKYPLKITTISNSEYDFINETTPKRLSNLVVVPNGSFDSLSKYEKTNHYDVVGYIGRIVDYKGIEELVKAFDKISEKHQKAKLFIYGEGENEDYYKNLVKNENIVFEGYTNDPLKAYSEMGIFVLPSWHEGLSLALLDAAMMQKALIATNIGGNPEVCINRQTGLLVKTQDIDSLAAALDKLLSSPSLQDKYAKNARKLFEEKYDFSKIVKEKIVPIYEE